MKSRKQLKGLREIKRKVTTHTENKEALLTLRAETKTSDNRTAVKDNRILRCLERVNTSDVILQDDSSQSEATVNIGYIKWWWRFLIPAGSPDP
ncbi:hypothetical protein Tco_1103243 [Tanacetum coccineum]